MEKSSPRLYIVVAGKRWGIEFASVRKESGLKYAEGLCDPPGTPNKRILLRSSLRRSPERLTEAVLHELFHAILFEQADEMWVDRIASDLARGLLKVLDAAGYKIVAKTNETQGG